MKNILLFRIVDSVMQRAAAAGGLLRSGRRGFSHAHLLQYSKKGLNVNLFKAFERVSDKVSDRFRAG
jgi:hypothetical protein